jgi:hypothetical protein
VATWPIAPRALLEGQRTSTREGTKATAGRALSGHEVKSEAPVAASKRAGRDLGLLNVLSGDYCAGVPPLPIW